VASVTGIVTVPDTDASGRGGDPPDVEARLYDARKERFWVRSRLKVLRRHRDRQLDAGHPTAELDPRIAELEAELEQWNERVEGLRVEAGRPSRARPQP
jgi:hypothetical protein